MLKKPTRIAIGAGAAVIATAAVASAIIVPLAKQPKYSIQYWENGAALQSLNYVTRGATATSPVYGFYMEGLIKAGTPQDVKGVVIASMKKRTWTKDYKQGSKVVKKAGDYTSTDAMYVMSQKQNISPKNFDPVTGDALFEEFDGENGLSKLKGSTGMFYDAAMADVMEYYSDSEHPSLRARIQENARWSNGDKVTADDFVQTIKYILDKKSGSVVQQKTYEILKLRGAKEIVQLQNRTVNPLTFEEAWDKVKKEGNSPVTTEGSEKRWVHYNFEKGAPSLDYLTDYLGGDVFMPTNKKFVDSIGGILKYGQTKNTVLANGPYVPDQLDLDYMIAFKRNPYYYQKEAVFVDHPAYKVSPSQAIQMQLFKNGKLSNIDIPQEFIQSFYSDPKLASLVTHGASAPATTGIMFSKAYADKNKHSPSANKNFRKAIQYGIDRNLYASYKNAAGSAPANAIYTQRRDTDILDDNGKTYYDYLLKDNDYEEKDPITNKNINMPYVSYDRSTQTQAFYSERHNNEYKDFLHQTDLANHFLDKYFEEANVTSATINVLIQSAEENQFLAFKASIEKTFGSKIKINAELVSPQIMTEKQYTGDFMMEFKSAATTGSDPWGLYSYFTIEDGYDETKANYQGYDNEQGEQALEVTSRYFWNPGFEMRDYVNTLSPEEKQRLKITQNDIDAWEEATKNTGQTSPGHAPTYKYTNDQTLIQKPTDGGVINYPDKTTEVSSKLSPHIASNGQKQSDWLFRNKSDLFSWYAKSEAVLRDSAYFVPLLSTTSQFFADRRGLRNSGNTQSLPYGYQFIYLKDNNDQIDKIEKEIRKKTGVSIALDRL